MRGIKTSLWQLKSDQAFHRCSYTAFNKFGAHKLLTFFYILKPIDILLTKILILSKIKTLTRQNNAVNFFQKQILHEGINKLKQLLFIPFLQELY